MYSPFIISASVAKAYQAEQVRSSWRSRLATEARTRRAWGRRSRAAVGE